MSYPFTHILGWSHSRNQTFSTCKRMYYLQYYSKFLPYEESSKVNQLKFLTSIPMELGTAIHHLIEIALRKLKNNRGEVDFNKLKNYVSKYVDTLIGKKQFFEVYYNEEIVDAEEMIQSILTKFDVFLNSGTYKSIKTSIEAGSTNTDKWVVESNGDKYGETRLGNTKAYCVIDFMMPLNEGTVIMDWKTGKESISHQKQLLAYILAAKTEFGVDPLSTKTKAVYISEKDVTEQEFITTQEELDMYAAEIKEQAQEMYSYCSNVDSNKPKSIEAFSLTEELTTCKYCKFKGYCGRL